MSDINTYADEAAITALSPIKGDLVLNQAESSLYLCINADASGINRWKKFANDAAVEAYQNRWGASFDGSNDYLSVSDAPYLNGASELTFSFWGKPTDASSALGAESRVDDSNRIILYRWTTGVVYFSVRNGSTSPSVASYALSFNSGWHHICGTYEGSSGTIKLYLDGSLVSTKTGAPATTPDLSKDLIIGKSGGAVFSKGLIDDVAILNSALSAEDITKIYNGTAPNGKPTNLTLAASYDTDRTANLKGYWRMGDHSNDTASVGGPIVTITDSSGNGNSAAQSDTTRQPTFADLTGETIYS